MPPLPDPFAIKSSTPLPDPFTSNHTTVEEPPEPIQPKGLMSFLSTLPEETSAFIQRHPLVRNIVQGLKGDTEVPNPLPTGPRELPINSDANHSILPEASGATSTLGKIGQGVYNYGIRPLGSPAGFLAAGSLHGEPSTLEEGVNIPKGVFTKDEINDAINDATPQGTAPTEFSTQAQKDIASKYVTPNRAALPEHKRIFYGGPSGNATGEVSDIAHPSIFAELTRAKNPELLNPESQAVNLGEVREANRQAGLSYGPEALNPSEYARFEIEHNPPAVSGDTSQGFSAQSNANLPYPLNVVPNSVRPRTMQSIIQNLTPDRFKEPVEEGPSVSFSNEENPNTEDNFVINDKKPAFYSNTEAVRDGEQLLPSAPPDRNDFIRGRLKSIAPNLPDDAINSVINKMGTAAQDAPEIAQNAAIQKSQLPFASRLANWVNMRRASNVIGERIRQQFSSNDLPDGDYSNLIKFQKDPTQFKDLQSFFSGLRENEIAHGLSVGEKENYLTQLWKETPDQIKQILGNKQPPDGSNLQAILNPKLGIRPSFTMPSIIKDYEWGIANGLHPRYNNLSEVAGWRGRASAKGIADIDFWNSMKANGDISSIRDETHSTALDPNFLPVKGEGHWYASPEIAEQLKNAIAPVNETNLEKGIAATKNSALSVGIPKTNITPHSFNLISRAVVMRPSTIPSIIKYMVSPQSAVNTISDALKSGELEDAISHGMTFSSEEHKFPKFGDIEDSKTGLDKIIDNAARNKYNIFRSPIFESLVPATKLRTYQAVRDSLLNSLSPDAAKNVAAHFANNFGGYNWRELGENPDYQRALKDLLFGGDWARTGYNIGKGVFKSLLDPRNPEGKPYRQAALNIAGLYTFGNMLNKQLSGHYMWENEPTHQFDIETGQKDSNGKSVSIGLLSPGMGAARILPEMALNIYQRGGDRVKEMLQSPLSPAIGAGLNLGLDENFFGRPMYGTDDFGRPISGKDALANIGTMLENKLLPSTVPMTQGVAEGSVSPMHMISGALGLPIRFYTPTSEVKAKRLLGSLRP